MPKGKEEPQITNQETPASTENLERVSESYLEEIKNSLEDTACATPGPLEECDTPGPLEERIKNFGPLAPADASFAVALEHEGLGPALLARKLKILLESYKPTWNQKEKKWEYFVDGELWRRCVEMIMKARGDYAPELRVNINIDAEFQDLLRVSGHLSPEEAQEKLLEYIDVKVEK